MVDVMKFQLVQRNKSTPSKGKNTAYLTIDLWNDFSFITMFYLTIYDEEGKEHDIGQVKIGFKGQDTSKATYETLSPEFSSLAKEYFSLGQSVEYYQKIYALPLKTKKVLLKSLNDMVFNPSLIEDAENEGVFRTSLLRDLSLSVIKGQFSRVLSGHPPLTNFRFFFARPTQGNISGLKLEFKVQANSAPSTNIHAIIGRNGVGKTTLLNNMIAAVVSKESTNADFYEMDRLKEKPISNDYFSSLVSVSFSAFDPFEPPQEQADPLKGTCYFYVGLKDREHPDNHRTFSDLRKDCANALAECFRHKGKTKRWQAAIKKLGSDENFDHMGLEILETEYKKLRTQISESEQSDSKMFRQKYLKKIEPYLRNMSSGHAIVLLTVTRLVATVEEKTLVLLDEPESHLHPPLLSAFIRALSDLLYDRNGVAIIATHSPVVLQEIPQSCCWKINRVGQATTYRRPEIETFGENVGVLTREIFGLEVSKSGFHDLLEKSVANGGTYQDILDEYDDQLGMEGRVILKNLVVYRDGEASHDADE